MKKHMRLAVLILAAGGAVSAAGAAVTIENEWLKIAADPATGVFSVTEKAGGHVVLNDGRWAAGPAPAKRISVSDKLFGTGAGIESGNARIMLFPGLPFALCRATLRNDGSAAQVLARAPLMSAGIDLSVPLADVRTLGTGGLLMPENNTGSYAFLSVVEPQSRRGVVGGWVTHNRGSGVVFSPVSNDQVRIAAQVDYGRLRIQPGGTEEGETFAIGVFPDARFGLEAYADAIAKIYAVKLPPEPAGFCTWYTEKYSAACDETHLVELATYAARELKPYGFDFVQIDDHWQSGISHNGPRRNFMAASPTGPYPSGMKATADNLKKLGLQPGIWFEPFAGSAPDPLFKDHQDWFAKDRDGKPFEAKWGGTCLDMTQPGAREYLRGLIQRLAHEWGYTVFKMDGFWTGTATRLMYVNDGYKWDDMDNAVLSDPAQTQIEAFRSGIKLVRQTAGPGVFLLGCCVSQNMRSFGGSFGLLDAMRVGPDTGAGRIGAPHASRLWFLNGRVWWNDPDCVSVRAATPLEQARLNASFTAIAGDLFYNSDWMPDFPAERLDILRRCIPAHGLPSRPVDVFENQPARIWHLADTREAARRDVVALYNWEKKPATIACPVGRIGLPPAKEYVGFDFWADKFIAPFKDEVRASLPSGGSCRILAIRPVADHPQLISTSRHITQGILEVTGEKWDAAARTLSGVSRVVANDPYELHIVVPVGADSWRAVEARAGELKTGIAQDGPKVRVRFTSPAGGEIQWQVRFEPANIALAASPAVAGLQAAADYGAVTLKWADAGADSYRIVRNDGMSFESTGPALVDATVEVGGKYRYTVQAAGWYDGAAAPASVEVAMPATLKRPPAPPAPETRLTQLKISLKGVRSKPGMDKSAAGGALSIEGRKYEHGVGVRGNATAVCAIPAARGRFVAVVGIDDATKLDAATRIFCAVYGDVKEMGEEPVLLARSPMFSDRTVRAWSFDLELNARFKELQLVVTGAGDGKRAELIDWVDAGFLAK